MHPSSHCPPHSIHMAVHPIYYHWFQLAESVAVRLTRGKHALMYVHTLICDICHCPAKQQCHSCSNWSFAPGTHGHMSLCYCGCEENYSSFIVSLILLLILILAKLSSSFKSQLGLNDQNFARVSSVSNLRTVAHSH